MVFNKQITFHLVDGSNVVYDDAEVPNAGTAAYNQFMAKQTIHSFLEDDGEIYEGYIPFHAIISATMTVNGVEVPIAADTNCSSECNLLWKYDINDSANWRPINNGDSITINHYDTFAVSAFNGEEPIESSSLTINPNLSAFAEYGVDEGLAYINNLNDDAEDQTGVVTVTASDCAITFTVILKTETIG